MNNEILKMNSEILKALHGSVWKWIKVWLKLGDDHAGCNCPLCQMGQGCAGCPIYWNTGKYQCGNTPWREWADHHSYMHSTSSFHKRWVECKECKRLALKEVKYLMGLLPGYKGKKITLWTILIYVLKQRRRGHFIYKKTP